MNKKDGNLMSLALFMAEQSESGQLSLETSNKIKDLWNSYKVNELKENHTIICADFGCLGSLTIRKIQEILQPCILKYEEGSYDYVDVVISEQRNILWTDFKDIEPYNRQSGLYCSGASFESLGKPININVIKKYREFDSTYESRHSISFGVWGFDFNDFYGSVRFGICLPNENVNEFIDKLKIIINK